MFKKFAVAAALVIVLGWAGTATAGSITIYDNGINNSTSGLPSVAATWTLSFPDACLGTSACQITLAVVFATDTNYAVGNHYLDSVQFTLNGSRIATIVPVSPGGFTTNTLSGTVGDWQWVVGANLSEHQCNDNGGPSGAGCGEWLTASTAGGFGPITTGMALTWILDVTFARDYNSFTGANIRAAFNNEDGSNYRIFSPDGGTTQVPEPGSALLLGSGLVGLGFVLRRRNS